MNKSTNADREAINRVNGFYIHLLDDDEVESLDRCQEDGYAIRDYSGPGGFFLGLPKVLVRTNEPE